MCGLLFDCVSRNIGVLDPTAEEEAQMDGSLTFTVNSRDVICSIQKVSEAWFLLSSLLVVGWWCTN